MNNLGGVFFAAIGMGLIGGIVVLIGRYAEQWRAEDPKEREGKSPPILGQIGKAFLWFILAALVLSVVLAVFK